MPRGLGGGVSQSLGGAGIPAPWDMGTGQVMGSEGAVFPQLAHGQGWCASLLPDAAPARSPQARGLPQAFDPRPILPGEPQPGPSSGSVGRRDWGCVFWLWAALRRLPLLQVVGHQGWQTYQGKMPEAQLHLNSDEHAVLGTYAKNKQSLLI